MRRAVRRMETGSKAGRFEQDIGGGRGDFGLQPTHDAGHGHRPFGVADDERLSVQAALVAVQGGDEGLVASGPTDNDTAAAQGGEVKGVQRLAGFEHHVVGDVDDIVDRPHAHGAQPLLQPLRRRADGDLADFPGGVTGTEFRRFDADLVPGPGGGQGRYPVHQRTQRTVGETADLAGDAAHTGAVGPVGRQVHLDHRVAQVEGLGERATGLQLCVQVENAAVVLVQAQFPRRAEHARGGDTSHLGLLDLGAVRQFDPGAGQGRNHAGLDIGRTADHLDAAVAIVHLADRQLVGIGMFADRRDPGNDDLIQVGEQFLDAVHLEPEHGQSVRDLGRGERSGGYELVEPTEREFHGRPMGS